MLCELRASQLGVIEDLSVVLGPGMTAFTGETGAGKTLLVEALKLLCGGRAASHLVRPGQAEATVEARLVRPGDDGGEHEVVLARALPAEGRSRAYVDGRMAPLGALAELGGSLVDLYGQHAHQSLLSPAAQRRALDSFAGLSTAERDRCAQEVRSLTEAMSAGGGDLVAREREADFLRYQLGELEAAQLVGPEEDELLAKEEALLGQAAGDHAAALALHAALADEDKVLDLLGRAMAACQGRSPLAVLHARLSAAWADLDDLAGEARTVAEGLEEDPARLEAIGLRRARLRELRRKYAGPAGSLAELFEWRRAAEARLAELESADSYARQAEERLAGARGALRVAAEALGRQRREAADAFGQAVQAELRRLAMPRACFGVSEPTGDEGAAASEVDELRRLAGEDLVFMFAANAGEPLLPLARTASGGELARAMLAVRLVLLRGREGPTGGGPDVLVFDEVDAGVGGEAALAVGSALARLAEHHQVLVVTHLAQVAAFAHAQLAVRKLEVDGRTVSTAHPVAGEERVVELSRMLSGQPDSETARSHARELLDLAEAGSLHTSAATAP